MADDTLKYVNFDYDSHLSSLIQRVRARYPGVWNDFQTGNFGRVLLDIVSFSAASTAFMINRAASENYVSTMTLRESAVRLGSNSGYKLKGPAPASVACNANLSTPSAADVTISQGTPVRTADSQLIFEVDKGYTIAAGSTTPLRTVVSFDPSSTGVSVLQTLVQVYSGQSYADVLDSSVNLPDYVSVGQLFRQTNPTSGTEYQISGLDTPPGSSSVGRMFFSQPWSGSDGSVTAEIIDRTITLVQGQTTTEQFVTPSSASPSYIVKLSRTPVIDGSAQVTVNGVSWSLANSLYSLQPDSTSFEVSTLPSGTTIVEFGDGLFGQVVPTDATISVTYRVGGGSSGNISSGSISATLVGLIVSLSNPVNVNVSNSLPGVGGLDAESLEEARSNIPASTKANDRCVTVSDYASLARGFSDPNYGQIRYALAYPRSENDFLERNIIVVAAWTSGVGGSLAPVSGPLKSSLQDYLQRHAVGTDYVIITAGTAVPVPVSVRFKVIPGDDVDSVAGNVISAVTDLVSRTSPGSGIVFSDLMRVIGLVSGVDAFNVSTPIGDLYPASEDQLFSAPDASYVYSLPLQSSSTTDNSYSTTLPIAPLAPWSIQLFLGSEQLSVLPAAQQGYAVVSGANLSSTTPSTINLLSGTGIFAVDGVPDTLTMKLIPAVGYTRERMITLYAGYQAEGDSQAKRREIRSALRSWISGFVPGSSLFASAQTNVAASMSNVTDVVLNVSGVSSVTRVAWETSTNPSVNLDLGQFEIGRLSAIFLNNLSD